MIGVDLDTEEEECLTQTTLTSGGGDGIVHLWCCDENVAWCGHDISDAEEWAQSAESDECVVCVYMWRTGYPCSPNCKVVRS